MKRLMVIALLASGAFAADFSHMSTEDMMNMRGSVPVDDRPSFQNEMQKRMQAMTPEERRKYKSGNKWKQKVMIVPTFAQYDLNNDGKITKSELKEEREKRRAQLAKEGKKLKNIVHAHSFEDIDTDKDGAISEEEFKLHQTIHHSRSCITFG